MNEVTIFFAGKDGTFFAAQGRALAGKELEQMGWLLKAETLEDASLDGPFVGPRREMISPWSTNAVEIAESVGLKGIKRIETFRKHNEGDHLDPC
jgi:phosphoribosylformylglycinamidine synthase